MSTSDWLLIGILAFVAIDFLIGTLLNYLNEKSNQQPLSEQVSQIYDLTGYNKSLEYGTTKYKFGLLTSVVSTIVILLAIVLGWFAWLDASLREVISSDLMVTVSFVGILIVLAAITGLPTSYYATFVIEEKFGFNKTTKKLFIADNIKQTLISLALGLPLIGLIAWIYQELNSLFWLVGWLLISYSHSSCLYLELGYFYHYSTN